MRRAVVVAVFVGVLALVGCDGGGASSWTRGPGSTAEPTDEVDSLESCLVGTWVLDVGFIGPAIEEGMADPDLTFSDVTITAIQTHTLADDGTFTAELDVRMAMVVSAEGQSIPMTVEGTGLAEGRWQVGDGQILVTYTNRDGTGTISGAGETVDLPQAETLGEMVMLPIDPYPVSCTATTMTIEVDGLSEDIPGAPDALVSTRR